MIIPELKEILQYYVDNYDVESSIDEVYNELIENNVEVKGNSFYCPIWNKDINAWLLIAGTKDKADMWVMKKIIKLIKSGDTIYSMLNGNSDYLLDKLKRYNVNLINRNGNISYISFNGKE